MQEQLCAGRMQFQVVHTTPRRTPEEAELARLEAGRKLYQIFRREAAEAPPPDTR